jgi:hypothetical protein
MASSTVDGDLFVGGTLRARAAQLPSSCVGDAQVSGASPVTAAKLRHRHAVSEAQAHGSASAARRTVVRVAHGDGEVVAVRAGVSVACVGDSTITVDVKKNGTTILSGTIGLDSGDAAFAKVAGTISDDEYVAGDVFETVVTVAAGTGTLGQGVFVDVVFDEEAG